MCLGRLKPPQTLKTLRSAHARVGPPQGGRAGADAAQADQLCGHAAGRQERVAGGAKLPGGQRWGQTPQQLSQHAAGRTGGGGARLLSVPEKQGRLGGRRAHFLLRNRGRPVVLPPGRPKFLHPFYSAHAHVQARCPFRAPSRLSRQPSTPARLGGGWTKTRSGSWTKSWCPSASRTRSCCSRASGGCHVGEGRLLSCPSLKLRIFGKAMIADPFVTFYVVRLRVAVGFSAHGVAGRGAAVWARPTRRCLLRAPAVMCETAAVVGGAR